MGRAHPTEGLKLLHQEIEVTLTFKQFDGDLLGTQAATIEARGLVNTTAEALANLYAQLVAIGFGLENFSHVTSRKNEF